MDEEETKQTDATETKNDGDNAEAIKAIADADKVAERLELANKRKEELLDREERIRAQSGSLDNGVREKKKADPYDDPVEYSKAVFSGKENPMA